MRFAARLMVFPFAAALAGVSPPPDSLGSIAEANGHAAAVHLRAAASHTLEGRTVTMTFDQLGRRWLARRCVAEICGGMWFDGDQRWTFSINEVPLPITDDVVPLDRTVAAIASYAFAEPSFAAEGGVVRRAGARRWTVTAPHGEPLVAVLDDALAVRRIERPDGRLVSRFERDAKAGGATFAMDRGGLSFGHYDTVTTVAGGLEAPDGAPVRFSGDAGTALDVSAGVPIVPCTLAGRAARCLLDTGTMPSALTLPFAERLGLEPRGEIEVRGFGTLATGIVETGPLALGAATFAHARFAVVPPSPAPFDVVVGSDLLARVRLDLDRGAGRARMGPAGAPLEDGIPLEFRNGVPYVAVSVGDRRFPGALLDTGDASIFSFGYDEYRTGPAYPVTGRSGSAGLAGVDDVLDVTVPDVTAGPLRIAPARASVRRTQRGAHLGIGMWTRCVVALDLHAARFACRPR